MPQLTATFTAETRGFQREIANARASVTGFERETRNVGRTLNRFANEFSGARVIRDAEGMARAVQQIGGVTRLTQNEQRRLSAAVDEGIAKYRALGQQVPPHLQQVQRQLAATQSRMTAIGQTALRLAGPLAAAFSIQGVLRFARGVTQATSDLVDLANRTAIGIEALQRIGYAAEQNGSSVEAMATAISRMQGVLIDGSEVTRRNLRSIGLELEELRRLRPEEAFSRIVRGVQATGNEMVQTQAIMRLFGRSGVEVLAAIRSGFAETMDEAVVVSEDAARAIKRFEDALTRARETTLAFTGETIGRFIQWAETSESVATSVDRITSAIQRAQAVGRAIINVPVLGAFGARVQSAAGPTPGDIHLPSAAPRPPAPPELETRQTVDAVGRMRQQVLTLTEDIQRGLLGGRITLDEAFDRWGSAALKAAEDMRFMGLASDETSAFLQTFVRQARELETRDILAATRPTLVEGPRQMRQFQAAIRAAGQSLATLDQTFVGIQRRSMPAIVSSTRDWGQFIDAARSSWVQMPDAMAGIERRQAEIQAQQEAFTRAVSDTSRAFANLAQISGDAFGGSLRGAAQFVAQLDAAIQSAQLLQRVLAQVGTGQRTAGLVGGAASAGLAGFGTGFGVGVATESRRTGALAGAGSGALTGAAIGSVVPGLGTAVGAGIGAVAGLLGGVFSGGGRPNEIRDPFIRQFGPGGTGPGSGFAELHRQLSELGEAALFEQLLSARNTSQAEAAADRITAAFEREARAAQDLVDSLGRVSQASGVISQAQARQLAGTRLGGPGEDVAAQFLAGQADQTLAGLQRATDHAAALTQQSADAIAAGLAAQFRELQSQGGNTFDLLQRIGPNVTSLREALDRAGLSGAQGLAPLERVIRAINDETLGPLIQTAQGASQGFAGLANQGLLTQGMFDGLQALVRQTDEAMREHGARAETIYTAIQQPLQNIWQLQQDFGFATDEATEKLLREAEAAGKIGDQFRPSEERMTRAIERLADRFEDFLTLLTRGTADAAQTAVRSLEDAFASARLSPIHVPVTADTAALSALSQAPLSRAESTLLHASATQPIVVESTTATTINLDGREAARAMARHAPQVLAGYGLA